MECKTCFKCTEPHDEVSDRKLIPSDDDDDGGWGVYFAMECPHHFPSWFPMTIILWFLWSQDKMMFCDHCDRGYHTYCVGVVSIPEGRWDCSMCIGKSSNLRRDSSLPSDFGSPSAPSAKAKLAETLAARPKPKWICLIDGFLLGHVWSFARFVFGSSPKKVTACCWHYRPSKMSTQNKKFYFLQFPFS